MRRIPRSNLSESFLGLRQDYAAARDNRFRRRRSGLDGAADCHYASETEFLRMREYVRDMDRNDSIIGQLVDRAVATQVRGGFALDVNTGDPKLDLDLWQAWTDWADDEDQCDLAGEQTFWQKEVSTLRACFVDGDIFHLPLESGHLQTVEADRCRTPSSTRRNVIHGVLLGEDRRRLEYWFTREPLDPFTRVQRVTDMLQYPARDSDGNRQVFHIYNPKRISQTRGVTAFSGVFDVCGMFEDVNFAKLVQQQMVSCFAAFLERTADYQFGGRTDQLASDSTTETLEELSPGLVIKGKKGERLTFPTGNVPNAEFFDHAKMLLTQIGLALGMPLIMVLLDASETSYTGWRGAWNLAKFGFEANQKWLRQKFHKGVYQWRVRHLMSQDPAIRAAANRDGIRIFGHSWTTPKWDYIDPSKDVEADANQLAKGLSSPRRIHAERGRDVEEIQDEIVADNSRMIRLAADAAKSLGVDGVTWRDLLNPFAAAAPVAPKPAAPAGDKPEPVRPNPEKTEDEDDADEEGEE